MRKLVLLIAFSASAMGAPAYIVYAQTAAPTIGMPPTAPGTVVSAQTPDVFLEYAKQLREENRNFEEHLEKQEETHQKFMEGLYDKSIQIGSWILGGLAGIFVVLGGIVGFLNWKTFRDIQSQVQKGIQKSVDKYIREEVEKVVERFKLDVEKKFQVELTRIQKEERRNSEIQSFVAESLVGLELVARGSLNPVEQERVGKTYEKAIIFAARFPDRRDPAIQLARWNVEFKSDLLLAIKNLEICLKARRSRNIQVDQDDGALMYNCSCYWNAQVKQLKGFPKKESAAKSEAQRLIDEALHIDPESREEAKTDPDLSGLSIP